MYQFLNHAFFFRPEFRAVAGGSGQENRAVHYKSCGETGTVMYILRLADGGNIYMGWVGLSLTHLALS